MSYLMVLFLMMLSFRIAEDVNKKSKTFDQAIEQIVVVFGGVVDKQLADRIQARDKEFIYIETMKESAEEGKFGEEAVVIVTEQTIQINLKAGVLFDSGKADLKPEALIILEEIAKNLLAVKNQVRVEGHTDNVPVGKRVSFKSNWELSMARAYSVISALEGFGVNPKMLAGIGYGEHRPIADNKTAEGRAKNRRITIHLIRIQ